MSFTGLCDDLQYTMKLLPYRFGGKGQEYSATWENGLKISADGQTIVIPEAELSDLWDYIRVQGIVETEEENTPNAVFYRMLAQMGYLSPVRILNQDGCSAKDGYQANEGDGRVFELQGAMA